MNSLLNLMYYRGKFFVKAATSSVTEVVKRWNWIKQQVHTEFSKATGCLDDVSNMWELLNNNTRNYNDSYVYTEDDLPSIKQSMLFEIPDYQVVKESFPSDLNLPPVKNTQNEIADKIIERLNFVLSNQEALQKNVAQLINYLESQNFDHLEQLKEFQKQLNKTNYIDDIFEEEITKCRFNRVDTKVKRSERKPVAKVPNTERQFNQVDTDVAKPKHPAADNKLIGKHAEKILQLEKVNLRKSCEQNKESEGQVYKKMDESIKKLNESHQLIQQTIDKLPSPKKKLQKNGTKSGDSNPTISPNKVIKASKNPKNVQRKAITNKIKKNKEITDIAQKPKAVPTKLNAPNEKQQTPETDKKKQQEPVAMLPASKPFELPPRTYCNYWDLINISQVIYQNTRFFEDFEKQKKIENKLNSVLPDHLNTCKVNRVNNTFFRKTETRLVVGKQVSEPDLIHRQNDEYDEIRQKKTLISKLHKNVRRYAKLIETNQKFFEQCEQRLQWQVSMQLRKNRRLLQELEDEKARKTNEKLYLQAKQRRAVCSAEAPSTKSLQPSSVLEEVLNRSKKLVENQEYEQLLAINNEQFIRLETRLKHCLAIEDGERKTKLLEINEKVFNNMENTLKTIKLLHSKSEVTLKYSNSTKAKLGLSTMAPKASKSGSLDSRKSLSTMENRYKLINCDQSKTEAMFVKEGYEVEFGKIHSKQMHSFHGNKFVKFVKNKLSQPNPKQDTKT